MLPYWAPAHWLGSLVVKGDIFIVSLWGVEPQSKEPESFILSIEL